MSVEGECTFVVTVSGYGNCFGWLYCSKLVKESGVAEIGDHVNVFDRPKWGAEVLTSVFSVPGK